MWANAMSRLCYIVVLEHAFDRCDILQVHIAKQSAFANSETWSLSSAYSLYVDKFRSLRFSAAKLLVFLLPNWFLYHFRLNPVKCWRINFFAQNQRNHLSFVSVWGTVVSFRECSCRSNGSASIGARRCRTLSAESRKWPTPRVIRVNYKTWVVYKVYTRKRTIY